MPARLKINIFTPLPPEPTEIANVNVPIVLALARLADVIVWTAQDDWLALPDPNVAIRSFRADAISYADLNSADANIFHIGNNVDAHQDIFDVCALVPGIIVLHDLNLHHFMVGLHHLVGRTETYLSQIERCHGPETRQAAHYAMIHGGLGDLIDSLPLTLAPATRATALLVHNPDALPILREQTNIPCFYLPLPFSSAVWPAPRPPRRLRPPYRMVMFGFLGGNRRVEPTLRALAASAVRSSFTLDIYGAYYDPPSLLVMIDEMGLQDQVFVRGFTPIKDLDDALAQADLALNLRYPTMGEASASQLRIWAHGLPSIVTRVGWYAAQPSECLHFIEPETEADDLEHALIDFCCHPGRWVAMGERGRTHVHSVHRPETYAEALAVLIRQEPEHRMGQMRQDFEARLAARLPLPTGSTERLATALFDPLLATTNKAKAPKLGESHQVVENDP